MRCSRPTATRADLRFVRNIGGPELLVILPVVLLLFGSTRLPGRARSLGQSANELRRGLRPPYQLFVDRYEAYRSHASVAGGMVVAPANLTGWATR